MKLPSLNTQIFTGVVLGVALGVGLAALGKDSPVTQNGLYAAGLVGTLFIDLLKMVLIPLVFTSIAVGVASLRAHQQMHDPGLPTDQGVGRDGRHQSHSSSYEHTNPWCVPNRTPRRGPYTPTCFSTRSR